MTPDLELEPGTTSATRKTTTTTTTTEPATEEVSNRHAGVKANPRRRRMLYALILFLAIAAVAVAIVDIFILRKDKDVANLATADRAIEFAVYGILVLLLIWALFMLFSRRSGQQAQTETTTVTETFEQMTARMELERTLMQCPDCKSVFQYGEIHFRDNKRTAFSCPVCGVYSKLPDPAAEPVKVLRPEGEFKELQYRCANCNEEIAIGTFGETPLHLVRFRACPSCGERGHIERIGSTPPIPTDPGFTPA